MPVPGLPEVAGQHLEVRDRLDVVDTGRVLGDSHRVEDRGLAGFAKPFCRGNEIFFGDTADLRDVFRTIGVLHHDLFDLLEILGPFRDELLVLPAVFDDLLHEAVEDGDIGAGVERQVQVCLLRRRGEPRVGVDDLSHRSSWPA